jgi:hypothetical protein
MLTALEFKFKFREFTKPTDIAIELLFFEDVWASIAEITGTISTETFATIRIIPEHSSKTVILSTNTDQLNEVNTIQLQRIDHNYHFTVTTDCDIERIIEILKKHALHSKLKDSALDEMPYFSILISRID